LGGYRAFSVDDSGRYVDAHTLSNCFTDEEALAAAGKLVNTLDIDVWEYGRKIASIRKAEAAPTDRTAA
jgi:hypothetical protein